MEDKVQVSNSAQIAQNCVLSAVQFTAEELSLLQSILVCMNDRLDWDFEKDSGLIEARVLLDFNESIPSQINNIYNKLF